MLIPTINKAIQIIEDEINGASDRDHAKFAPSSSGRWLHCPSSFYLHNKYPPRSSGPAALEGTVAHAIGAMGLTYPPLDLHGFLDQVIATIHVDEEMIYYMKEYVNLVQACADNALSKNPGHIQNILGIEEKVRLNKDCYGTVDACIIDPPTLHIWDLKYGRGQYVSEKDNTQLKIYAVAKMISTPSLQKTIENVCLHIYQPRYRDTQKHRYEDISISSLKKFGKETLIPMIERIQNKDNLTCAPSKGSCKWCAHSANCKPLAKFNLGLAQQEFSQFMPKSPIVDEINELSKKSIEALSPENKKALIEISTALPPATQSTSPAHPIPDPVGLTDEELVHIRSSAPLFKSWLNSIEEELLRRAKSGRKIPGIKVVKSRKQRIWKFDESKTLKGLKTALDEEECYKKKLISPAQAEKKMVLKGKKKSYLANFIMTPDGGPTLANSTDSRRELTFNTPTDDFDKFKPNTK